MCVHAPWIINSQATPDTNCTHRGAELDGSTAGIAFKSTMCDGWSSVGVSQDSGNGMESVGSIAAHELGHIFNMDHDSTNNR